MERGAGVGIERLREFDGGGGVDLKAAAGVYFAEMRARIQDVVVHVFFVFLPLNSTFTPN
jgi:carbon catabolite-derepressing protein kinase